MATRKPRHAERAGIRGDFIRCRTLGHAWDAIPVTEPPSYGVAIDLRCIHCFTIRRDVVSRSTAALMSRRYSYPDDYRDAEQHTRQDWRAMWVSTLDEALYAIGKEPNKVVSLTARRTRRKVS